MPLLESRTHKSYRARARLSSYIPLFIIFLLFCSPTYSANILTIANTDKRIEAIDNFIDVLDNPDQKIHQNNILTPKHLNQFTPINLDNALALAHFSSYLWFKFTLRNNTDSHVNLWLTLHSIDIESFQIFQSYNGHLKPLNYGFKNNQYITSLTLDPLSTHTFFINLSIHDKSDFSIQLVEPKKYHTDQLNQSHLDGVILGILIIVLTLSLVCSIHFKNIIFLYFLGYAGTSLALQKIFFPLPLISSSIHFDTLLIIYLMNFTGIMVLKNYLTSWSLFEPFKRILTISHIVNLLGSILLALLFTSESPYIWSVYTLLIPVHIMAMLYCFQLKNDRIAASILSVKILCICLIVIFIFFSNNTINLHHMSSTYIICITIFEIVSTLFLLIKHFQLLNATHDKDLLLDALNNIHPSHESHIINEITHDLRTPIAGIMGMAELLKNAALPAAQLELVDSITHSGQLLLNKVSEIDTRLQTQVNDPILQKSTFELPLLIEECAYGYGLVVEEKNIEFIIHIHRDIPAIVQGDINRIRQILMHLIENAIKNTAQGEVIIGIQYLDADNHEILFSVKDTGRGISQKHLQHLLTDKELEEGRGLSITKLHLRTLGSELNISSKLGEGSEFTFSLNLPPVTYPDLSSDSENINNQVLKNKNLLVVDDNHTCCKVIKQQAVSWGMQAIETYDGNEALAMFRAKRNISEPFDAIVIDYDMPHLSGLEVAEKILNESSEPPVMIMLTGFNVMPPEHLLKQAGIQAILTKPTSQKIIKLTLIDLLLETQKKTTSKLTNDGESNILNILIVEDNDVSRRVISKMIGLLGHHYKMVSDGQLAVDVVKKESFDLILMDCEMPVMNGFDASIEIHRWQRHQGRAITPIIALTAHTMEAHKQKSQNAGMMDFLEKPIKINELKATLARFKKVIETV